MKKLVVDQNVCLGCGICYNTDNEHFEFNDQGLSYAKSQENIESPKVQEAINACPVSAIKIIDDEYNKLTKRKFINSDNQKLIYFTMTTIIEKVFNICIKVNSLCLIFLS